MVIWLCFVFDAQKCSTRRATSRARSHGRRKKMKAAVHTLLLCSAACALHQPIIKRAPEPQMATKADSRGQIAKARRAVLSDGGGGFTTRVSKKKKKSEQKAPPSGKGFSKTVRGLNFDRVPNHDAECACGDNGRSYGDCCAPFHEGKFFPKTPAELTQARYTAFAYRLPDYLMETTDPEGEEWNKDAAGWKKGLLGFWCARSTRALFYSFALTRPFFAWALAATTSNSRSSSWARSSKDPVR